MTGFERKEIENHKTYRKYFDIEIMENWKEPAINFTFLYLSGDDNFDDIVDALEEKYEHVVIKFAQCENITTVWKNIDTIMIPIIAEIEEKLKGDTHPNYANI